MYGYVEAAADAAVMLSEYDLCERCLGRMFARRLRLSSNVLLGKKLGGGAPGACHICRGLAGMAGRYALLMSEAASGYEFSSFSVGCTVRPSVIDRDDQIRSKYKMRGADGIKTAITRDLGRAFARRIRAAPDWLRPEIAVLVDTRDGTCTARSRSVVVRGRYVKTQRGIPQKRGRCSCGGAGCAECGLPGSIEWRISGLLTGMLGGTTSGFTWVGGEDKSSLVLGSGRPFYARIRDPRRRSLGARSRDLGPVRLAELEMVPGPPDGPLRFESTVRITVLPGAPADLGRLRGLSGAVVTVYDRSGRRSEKKIHSVKYRRRGERVEVVVRADGGLPIKRFVSGDEVRPGISQALGVPCTCLRFDFADVSMLNN